MGPQKGRGPRPGGEGRPRSGPDSRQVEVFRTRSTGVPELTLAGVRLSTRGVRAAEMSMGRPEPDFDLFWSDRI